jgi:tRNA (cytosine49-C5)-methyltransferase
MHEPAAELPELFVERLGQIVPAAQYDAVLGSFGLAKPVSFRVNRLRADIASTRQELDREGFPWQSIGWLDEASTVPPAQKRALTETAAWQEGRIYIQGLSSMLAPLVLGPRPGETVLDLAAAPGGKTIQIAAMMQNEGVLSAVEPVRNRFFRLQDNVRRCGATMVKFYQTDGRTVGRKTPDRFDRILLDAPCSSEARFRTSRPESWQYWSGRKIKECARKQFGLLNSALDAVRPGGLVLYGTCSFAPEENELIVDRLLRKRDDAELLPVELPIENVQGGLLQWQGKSLHEAVSRCVRVLPDSRFDGFFMAKLRKKST